MASAHQAEEPAGPAPPAPRILVALATYNEADNIRPLVETIRGFVPACSVLIIDDNSPDGTGEICDRIAAELADVRVLHRTGKLGLGSAILEGMRYSIEHGYDYFVNLDADFSHPPRYLPNLIAGMDRHDVMIGSRYVPGGGIKSGFNWTRKFMSAGINWYTRLLLGLKCRDNSGSYRCYRVSKLAAIDFGRVKSLGYSFLEEILFWCKTVGCEIGETPIQFEARRAGLSKINKLEVVRALRIILELGLDRVLGRT